MVFFFSFSFKRWVWVSGLANLALLEVCIYRILKKLNVCGCVLCRVRFVIFSARCIYFVELCWWPPFFFY
jgi:hypothetical protein